MKRRFILAHAVARGRALDAVRTAPDGFVVSIQEPTRSLDQNAKMWPMLHDVATQVRWPVNGELVYMNEDDWKDLFTAALKREQRMAQGVDGGFVMLGTRSSTLTKREFSDLIEIMYAFGAERGVQWSEPAPRIAA